MTPGFRDSACRPAKVELAFSLEAFLFQHRAAILILSTVITLLLALSVLHLERDTGFEKHLPTRHPYMQTYLEHQNEFGGANRVLIAVRAKDGDIFDPGGHG
jgi:uncharacterized protein